MAGDLSLGLLLGFFIVTENFLRPVGQFLEFADQLRVLEADILRVRDVLAAKSHKAQATATGDSDVEGIATIDGRLRLIGRVCFENVTFGFRHDTPLVKKRPSRPGTRATCSHHWSELDRQVELAYLLAGLPINVWGNTGGWPST